MSKTFIVPIVIVMVLGLVPAFAQASFFEEKLQVTDSVYQDKVFGGSLQPTLIITFTPGDDLADDGDYSVIVDVDDDGDFNDEPISSYIQTDTATPNSSESVTWSINSKLSTLNDGVYDIAVVIDNLPDGKINWGDEVKLFSVTDNTKVANIKTALNGGTVHDDLRNEFDSLSNNLDVTGSSPEWQIEDNDTNRTYIVKENGADLDIYQEVERDQDSEKFTLDKTLSITEVSVSPETFSPNGDGSNDNTTIHYTLSESLSASNAGVTITIGEGQLASPAKPTAGTSKGLNSVTWNGKDGLGNYVPDGTYTIKIEAKDLGGNVKTETATVKTNTKLPGIAVVPEADSFVSALTQVKATLTDTSGEGIDLTKSTIRLKNPSNADVPGSQIDNESNVITWKISSPLPGDGSVDGKYTIVVTAYDKIGNHKTANYTFFYDTVFPQITSVTPTDDSVFVTPPPNVVLVVSDGTGSGADLTATKDTFKVRLDGSDVSGSSIHNGVDTITFTPFKAFAPGQYTIEVSPTDFAGNKPSQSMQFQFTVFENASDILPGVVSTTPAKDSFVNKVSLVTAVLKDNSGKGLDLSASTIKLQNPQGSTVSGRQIDDGESSITWELANRLPADGSADGTYIIKVKAVDKAGGIAQKDFTFLYDTQVPNLVSITPENGSILATALSEVVIKINDGAGSGVDFDASKETMTLSNVSSIIRTDNGVDTMTFRFPALENTGKYTVEIVLKDNAGNQYTLQSRFEIVEATTDLLPQIVLAEPADGAFVNVVSQVKAELQDNSGRGLNLAASSIRLVNSQGNTIAGRQMDDGSATIAWELTNPLPTNGSADGVYTVNVTAADKAGGTAQYSSTFLYDTQVPELVSVTPADGSVVITTLSQIVMQVSDGAGSGLDFAASKASMSLTGVPNIIRADNGVDTMTFRFPALVDTGKYVTEITLRDRAGNEYTYESSFDFVEDVTDILPEVASVDPPDRSFLNTLTKVTAVLQDNSGKGIDLNMSTIRLENAQGVELAGFQTAEADNTIVWNLASPLPTDGSADGTYTIKVMAVDKAGRSSEYSSTFLYDTQVPEILSITPADGSVTTPPLSKIVIRLSDVGNSGVDFAYSKASMTLTNVADSRIVRTDNGVDTMTFSFPALQEFGKYTIGINLKDKAGNEYAYQASFDFVEKSEDILPEVVSVEPPESDFANAVSQVKAVLKDNSGKGINFALSTVSLENSQGTAIAGTKTNDGVETIALNLKSPLPTDGSADGTYTIKVTAVDKAGGTTEYSSTFLYDTQIPDLVSTVPADGDTVTTALSEIVVQVSDGTGSGLNFAASRDSASLTDVSNIIRRDNGVDTMTFRFAPLKQTGKYTFQITLVDNAGNQYTYQTEFDFVEKTEDVLPEVVSVEPADTSSVKSLLQITSVLKDNSGSGLDLDASKISLQNPQGAEMPGVQTNDKIESIVWKPANPLPTDGSADGAYTIKVMAVDKTGGTTEYSSTFLYDTQVPKLVSITPANASVVTEALSEIVIQVSDGGSGLDFAASKASMSLSNVPNIIRTDNGVDTMTFRFPALENNGKYTVEITLSDNAGNQYTYQSSFEFAEKTTDLLPEVSSVEPQKRAAVSSLSKVTATLKDNSGKGISIDSSTIGLENPQGAAVSGIQTDDGDTITWELTAGLATDGSADGTYTIKVKAVDKTGGTTDYSATFVYDTLSPSVVSTTPAANEIFYEGISTVSVKFDDGDGSGVDLEATTVELQGPNGVVAADRSNNGKDIITLTFSKLTDSGNYVIQVSPVDKAGNAGYPVKPKFSYVLKPPAVKSVSLTNEAYIKNLDSIEAMLEDRSGIGLDLTETGSSIVVIGPDGMQLQSDQTSVGSDTIVWKPVHMLATDGTDDGTYKVTVTPMDTAGTSGQSRQYTLIYDTQAPKVLSATPVDINEIIHISQQVTSVAASLEDEGPAGIDVGDQTIYLEKSDKTQVPGVRSDNGSNTVSWNLNGPLAKNGTADGTYNVVVVAVDRAGNQREFRYPFVYDTAAPKVVEVVPANNALLNANITQVSAKLQDSSDGKIDFQSSGIELRTPSGGIVSGLTGNDGVSSMTFTFAGLEENGVYTVLVTAVDKAGNGIDINWTSKFSFQTSLPVVISTTPVTNPPDKAYTSQSLTQVRAVLQETGGFGIDLSPTGSEISLKGPDGKLVVGSQSNDGRNTLIFTLGKPFANDGSDDGLYTILVKTANAAKRKDDMEREFKFTCDTQPPEIVSSSPLDLEAELSYVKELITNIDVKLADEGPAGINLKGSSIKLLGPNGNQIEGTVSNNGTDTLSLIFRAGLSLEGTYSLEVAALDKAGNTAQAKIHFIYAFNIPEVVSTVPPTVPADSTYVNSQIKEVRVVLNQTGNGGIDLSATGSTVSLVRVLGQNSEQAVQGNLSNDGNNMLVFTLTKPLATDGSDDGQYAIVAVPANSAKLKGSTVKRTFFYDTVAPEVEIDYTEFGYSAQGSDGSGRSLVTVWAKVTDPSKYGQSASGTDWDNYDNSWIKLQDSDGVDRPGIVSVDKTAEKVTLVLDRPLASSGKDDRYYTVYVRATDKAGNTPALVDYRFYYDTRPPTVNRTEITINDKPLLLDSILEDYPTAVNSASVTIAAKMEDDGKGVDLTASYIKVTTPDSKEVGGVMTQDGMDTIWFKSELLSEQKQGLYKVEINPIDLDGNGGSGSPETIFTEFLFETGKPVAEITEPAGDEVEAEDEHITLKGTATDNPDGGISDENVSGVAKVEIGGTGPNGEQLEWGDAVDKSEGEEKPWSHWAYEFLPDASGTYEIQIRVWDNAGNSETYVTGKKLTFTISLSFRGNVYCWPNPVTTGVAHISFEINIPEGQTAKVKLLVYDVSGDLVYEEEHADIPSKSRTSVEWGCINAAGEKVATGIYLFRLEAKLPDGETANKIGKPMVIKN